IKWDAVLFGENGYAVGTDFIRGIAVGGNAVRTDDHQINPALPHEIPCHTVGNERHGNPVALEFPSRQACTLQEWTGFVRHDLDLPTGKMRRPYDAQCRSIPGCR